jgi:LPXTG-motif cell wall-anchored protein
MRHIVGIAGAAVATAAALRHIVHVYIGFSREEIRTIALIAAGIGVLVAIILFRRRKRQP